MSQSKSEKIIDRIPYETWANSQLSIAKYYGGCTLNGSLYILDYKNARKKIVGGEERLFPDLILANEEIKCAAIE